MLASPAIDREPAPRDGFAAARPGGAPAAAWLALGVVFVLVALVRWRLLDVPLERDEGEYAYAGRLWLSGRLPYQHVYNMKLPGIYALYAGVLTVFGETTRGIHVGLLAATLVSTALVFALGRRLFDAWTGVAAAALFATLGLGRGVQGLFANAEAFVLPFALGGLVLLARALAVGSPRVAPATGAGAAGDPRPTPAASGAGVWIGAGLLFGAAVVVKQHAALFLAFAGLAVLARECRAGHSAWRRMALFALAAVAPYGATAAYFAARGAFPDFWFWTFEYARTYAAATPLVDAPTALRIQLGPFLESAWAPWTLAGLGLIALAVRPHPPRVRSFVLGLALASFLATCPGFYFRPHYFVLVLPALALMGACALRALHAALPATVPAARLLAPGLLAATLAQPLAAERDYLFTLAPAAVARATYGLNPFAEAVEAGAFLARSAAPGDTVAVFGSEPQIPFYAGLAMPTGFVYTYALMEEHEYALAMQQRWIREVGDARPRFIVVCNNPLSWLARDGSHRLLFTWFEGFRRGYELRAAWDTTRDGKARSYVGDELGQRAAHARPGQFSLEIWERAS